MPTRLRQAKCLLLAAIAVCAAHARAAPDPAEAEALIVAESTRFRAAHRVGPLASEPRLAAAARAFAAYMARTGRYAHDADGRQPHERASAQGYAWCVVLENIAWVESSRGFSTAELAQRLMDGWKQSPPHRANLLDASVPDTGVGLAFAPATGRWYAVQMFGRSHAAEVAFSVENPTGVPVRYRTAREAFVLEPGMTRSHRLCVPQPVTFEGVSGAATLEPRTGDRWVVEPDGAGGVRLAKKG